MGNKCKTATYFVLGGGSVLILLWCCFSLEDIKTGHLPISGNVGGKLFENQTNIVDCSKLFDNNLIEIAKARSLSDYFPTAGDTLKLYTLITTECEIFKRFRRYVTEPMTPVEAKFPLAYSIMTFKDVDQTERLLRAIYRPQNLYLYTRRC